MFSKYKRRPDQLEEMVSSHFGKMMKTGKFNNVAEENQDTEQYDSESDDDDENVTEDEDPNVKFNYIITEADDRGE